MSTPVGWRWRLPSDTQWQFTDGPEEPRLGLPTSFEAAAIKEPVFAARSAPEAGKAVTLRQLQSAHIERQAEWCPDQVPDLSFRGNEMAGEVGEACNVIKKLERERHGWRGSRATKEQLAEELGDVIHTAILCAITAGIDIEPATVAKFNSTSEKNGLSTFISALASVAPSGAEPTQAVPAEDVTERPLSRMRSDDGRPMWEQISDLIKFHMNERPPIRLRDELVTILDWARYGEARLIDAEAEATSLRRKLEEHRTALAEARQQTSTRDDERCRWPECTCYGPQAPNHCKRQTRRTLDARALSEREGQEE